MRCIDERLNFFLHYQNNKIDVTRKLNTYNFICHRDFGRDMKFVSTFATLGSELLNFIRG